MSTDYDAACGTSYYPAAHQSGSREAPCIAYVVIHDAESATDEQIGSWFGNISSAGSAHRGVDGDSCERFLDDDGQASEAWGAPPLNDAGLHIEQAGYASWSRPEWLAHIDTIRWAAHKVAAWCLAWDIPAVWLSVADLKAAGATPASPQGITSHANVSLAFGQSTHTDPGPGYPVDVFMAEVKAAMTAIPAPPEEEDDMFEKDDRDKLNHTHSLVKAIKDTYGQVGDKHPYDDATARFVADVKKIAASKNA